MFAQPSERVDMGKSKMIRNRRRSVCLALLPLGSVLVGCQSPQTKAAHQIADVLPRSLGPAKHYDVQVEGDAFALARGQARRIHVVGQEVLAAPDTTLDTLDMDARDVSFDPSTKRIEKAGAVIFVGTVGQENLTAYLAHRRPMVPGMQVVIRSRDLQATVPLAAAGLRTTATVSGTLAPDARQPDHLDFVADSASLGGLSLPPSLVNFALREINPVFDLSHEKVPILLQQADVVNGTIVLQGTANLDNLQP